MQPSCDWYTVSKCITTGVKKEMDYDVDPMSNSLFSFISFQFRRKEKW